MKGTLSYRQRQTIPSTSSSVVPGSGSSGTASGATASELHTVYAHLTAEDIPMRCAKYRFLRVPARAVGLAALLASALACGPEMSAPPLPDAGTADGPD